MKSQQPIPDESDFIAGEVCLDFANTVDWHASSHPEENLSSYKYLVAWSRSAGLLDDARAEKLLKKARGQPQAARSVLKRAVSVREALYRIIVAILHDESPAPEDLGAFNGELESALRHLRVVPREQGLGWGWKGSDDALDAMLWPILSSAASLLTSKRRDRIGQCADDRGCGWLFLDKTRNHSRRWCEMKDCGNRAKAKRHYQRRPSKSGAWKRYRDERPLGVVRTDR